MKSPAKKDFLSSAAEAGEPPTRYGGNHSLTTHLPAVAVSKPPGITRTHELMLTPKFKNVLKRNLRETQTSPSRSLERGTLAFLGP